MVRCIAGHGGLLLITLSNYRGKDVRLLVLGELPAQPHHLERLRRLRVESGWLDTLADEKDARRRIAASEYVFFNNIDVNPVLDALAGVRLAVLAATGYGFIDLDEARRLAVPLAYLPSYSTTAVAEYVLWAALDGLRPLAGTQMIRGMLPAGGKERWFGRELARRRAGVVGYGRVGRQVARLLRGVGMEVVATSQEPTAVPDGRWLPLDELLASSDIVCLCVSVNPTTRSLMDEERLLRLREDAVLVSISPKETIDLAALVATLRSRPGIRAVLDLDMGEDTQELLTLPNARVTPHVAFATGETLERRFGECIDQLEAFLSGQEVDWIKESGPASRRVELSGPASATSRPHERLLEKAGAFLGSQVLYAIVKLGVAAELSSGPRSVRDLAWSLRLAVQPLELLLLAGVRQGLLRGQADGSYALSEDAAPLLDVHSAQYMGDTVVSLIETSYGAWGRLVEFVRSDKSPVSLQELRQGQRSWAELTTAGSEQWSRATAHAAVDALGDVKVERVLDVGAGGAAVTRELLARWPEATATLVDRGHVLGVAKDRFLAPLGLDSRCEFRDRDFLAPGALDGEYDVVVLSNIIHMLGKKSLEHLLGAACGVLRSGGVLLATSFFTSSDRTTPAFNALFSLSCRLLTGVGRTYSPEDVAEVLRSHLMDELRVVSLGALTGALLGRKRP